MGANIPLLSFAGAEIGEEAQGRIDLELYPTTAEIMENILPSMRGSMFKAPGSEYIGTLATSVAIVRPFAFNVDQTRVLEISDSQMQMVDGNQYVTIVGAAATVGVAADNGSSGGASVTTGALNCVFTATAGGQAKAYWQITAGVNGSPTTFQFEIKRRPIRICVGTTTAAEDILSEITLEPGSHIITILPTATTYYFRARLTTQGKAELNGLTRKAAGKLTIPTPWPASELASLRFRQSNDVVYCFHPDYRTRVLERRGDTSWSLRLFRPENGPFEKPNTTTVTLTPSATSGSINLVSNSSLFKASSVGQLIELDHQGQTETLDASAVDQASDPIRVIGIDANRVFTVSVGGTFVGTVVLQRSFGNEVDWVDFATYTSATSASVDDDLDNQIVYYRLICTAHTSGTIECALYYGGGSTTGRGEIVEYTSPTQVVVEVYENFGRTSATTRWSLGSWSDEFGWPAAGLIEDARLYMLRDDRLFGSATDDYEDHETGVEASSAMSRSIAVADVNTGRWIEMASRIVAGTAGGEVQIGSNNLDEPITYLNIRAKPAGDTGSANAQAVRAGKRIVFIDRTRTKLMQAYMDGDTGDIEIDDLARLHEKIAGEIEQGSGDGFIEVAFQRAPEPRLWVPRSDGQLVQMLYVPREGIYGWARIKGAMTAANVAGKYKSVCVIPGSPEDRVHVLVERVINGETVLLHERLSLHKFPVEVDDEGKRSAPKAWRLQCALATDGEEAETVFGGLDHLEGEEVAVWADGRDAGRYTVEGGQITLDDPAYYVIIGLLYEGRWKSSKLAFGARNGTALTQDKNVGRLGVIVFQTPVGVLSYGRDFDHCDDTLANEFSDGFIMDGPAILHTSEESQPFEGVTEIDARVCLKMKGPAPVTIQALVPNVDLEEHV